MDEIDSRACIGFAIKKTGANSSKLKIRMANSFKILLYLRGIAISTFAKGLINFLNFTILLVFSKNKQLPIYVVAD